MLDFVLWLINLFCHLFFWMLMGPTTHSTNTFDDTFIKLKLRSLIYMSLLWRINLMISFSFWLNRNLTLLIHIFVNLIRVSRDPILNKLLKIIGNSWIFFLLWPVTSHSVSHIDVWSSDAIGILNGSDLLLHWLLYILHLHHMILSSLDIFIWSHLVNCLTLNSGLTSWEGWVSRFSHLLVDAIECWLNLEIHIIYCKYSSYIFWILVYLLL